MSLACIMRDGRNEWPVDYGTAAWDASMEWARFHGLDPNKIPAGSMIERDAAGRRILFESFTFDDEGDLIVDGMDAVIVHRVEQGEAPPLPFPVEVTG